MDQEKAKQAKQLLEDIAEVKRVIEGIHNEPFRFMTLSNHSVRLTPDIRQEIRDCLRDYRDRKQAELQAL